MKSSGGLIDLYKASIKGTSRDPGSDECVECVTEIERGKVVVEEVSLHLCVMCLCEKKYSSVLTAIGCPELTLHLFFYSDLLVVRLIWKVNALYLIR